MFILPQQHDRIAQSFEDLAISMDAGLDLVSSLGDHRGETDASAVERIAGQGFALAALDHSVLAAAERAGELPRGLRDCADWHRFQAESLRLLGKKLAYPALLLCLAGATLMLLGFLGFYPGAGLLLTLSTACLVLCGFAARSYFRAILDRPGWQGRCLPGLHLLLRDLGIIPYLQALHALYRSGVTIHEAHEAATRVSPVAWVRLRLARASHDLEAGLTLCEALTRQAALDEDSLALLRRGELSGSLEQSLARAADLRQQILRKKITRASAVLGAALYLGAVLAVLYVAVTFYASYFATLSGRF